MSKIGVAINLDVLKIAKSAFTLGKKEPTWMQQYSSTWMNWINMETLAW